MVLLAYIIFAFAAGWLVYLLLKKPVPKVVIVEEPQEELPDITSYKNDFETKEAELFKIIKQAFPEHYTDDIRDGVIATGMPEEFLMMAWGQPGQKETLADGEKIYEKWYYVPDMNDKTLFKTEVQVEQNKITGWKDL